MDPVSMRPTIVAVHIGAGTHAATRQHLYEATCRRAIKVARSSLNVSHPTYLSLAMDAVVAAVQSLEDDPIMNAGTGSNLTWDGHVECDASIMDGQSGLFGSVGAVNDLRYPIVAAAHLTVKQSFGLLPGGRIPPMFLVSNGASRWLSQNGHTAVLCDPEDLITYEARVRHARHRRICESGGCNTSNDSWNHDTVGAVVLDAQGNLSAGVSSGGISVKYSGRIGEAAMVGSGIWVQNTDEHHSMQPGVAVSCSGTGEHMMQTQLAQLVANRIVEHAKMDDQTKEEADMGGCVAQEVFAKMRHAVHGQQEVMAGYMALVNDNICPPELYVGHSTPSMGFAVWNGKRTEFILSRKPAMASYASQVIGLC